MKSLSIFVFRRIVIRYLLLFLFIIKLNSFSCFFFFIILNYLRHMKYFTKFGKNIKVFFIRINSNKSARQSFFNKKFSSCFFLFIVIFMTVFINFNSNIEGQRKVKINWIIPNFKLLIIFSRAKNFNNNIYQFCFFR